MAVDKKISQLTSLAQVDVSASTDVLPIVDTSATETKKITVSALVGAGATAGISGAVLTNGTINSTTIGATTPSTGAFTTLSASGNLTFSSTAQRITGDMSNATIANRLAFQTSTVNGETRVLAIPNGTATASRLEVVNNSDPTNCARFSFVASSTEVAISSAINGTGTYVPINFFTGGSERMRIDTSGNVGIGTASPGNSKLRLNHASGTFGASNPLQTWAYANFQVINLQIDGSVNPIWNTDADSTWAPAATMIWQYRGSEQMRLSSSGNVGIGTASPSQKLDVAGTSRYTFNVGNAYTLQTSINAAGSAFADDYKNALSHIWQTSGSERMRIDSSGNVGIGGTAGADTKLNISGTLPSSGTVSRTLFTNVTVPSGTTAEANGFQTSISTQAASFTLGSLFHFHAVQSAIGAGSAITNQYGFAVNSGLTGATNNYGFYSNIASGSNRWNFYAAGTAANYFAGTTTVGTTNVSPAAGNVAGVAIGSTGYVSASRSGDVAGGFNRGTNDGDIITLHQDGTQEGSISVSGNTISYNAFAGSHWSQLQNGSKPDILRGTVMESINELCVWPDENNERLPKSKISDTAGSKKVYGVFMAWDNDWTATNDMLVTSVGAFICRVNSSVTVQEGDLLESNGDGTARVQADDIIRSSTIGKVTSTVKTHQYADGSYCVPTVLYCG